METRPLFRRGLRTLCTSTSRSVYHLRFDLIAKCPLKEDRNKNCYCESSDGHNPRCDSCPQFLGLYYCGNQCNESTKTTYCSKVKYKNLGEAFASSDDIHIYQCEDSCKIAMSARTLAYICFSISRTSSVFLSIISISFA